MENLIGSEAQNIDYIIITPAVTKFLAVAKTLDRFGISHQAGATIALAALQDASIVSLCDVSNVIDRNKIWLERTKASTIISPQAKRLML